MKKWLVVLAAMLLLVMTGCGNNSSDPVPLPQSSAKAITTFSLNSVSGTINEAAKTIAVAMPFGTDVTALVATFTTTGESVKVGSTIQASGTTANNFTNPVIYTVTAADSSTQDYTVVVTVAASSSKAFTAFSLNGVTGTINGPAKTLAVTMPFGTDVTALVATFTATGASVKIGSIVQASGTTANNFTNPVIYTVTAADATTQDYTVTVTLAPSTAKTITAFSLNGAVGTINQTDKTIAVTMPFGAYIMDLVATFTTTGANVKVGSTIQVSGVTAHNFTGPVVYTVTAADASTQDYTVTVTVAPSMAKAMTAFSFSNVPCAVTINEGAHTIAATVPSSINIKALAAAFTSTGFSVKVGSNIQVSGVTANNFTAPVTYTVTAADSSTQDYIITVTTTPSGSLDASFGTGGIVTTAIGSGAQASALGIQPDGRIVAAGYSYNGSNNDFALARYNADGTLDTTFGTGGIVITAVGSGYNSAWAIGIQSDGRIVVAGASYNGSNDDFALVRYNTNGSLDTTFGADGIVTTAIGSGNESAYALGIQPDGKIVAAGYSYNGSDGVLALVRYNTNGTLDANFGAGGIVTTAIGSGAYAYALSIQTDGRIVAAGKSSNGSNADFVLVRHNANGSLDTTFGTGGIVTTAIGSSDDFVFALGIQSDGRIVAAGKSWNGSNYDFTLARYNTNGTLDANFGTGGIVTKAIGSGYSNAYALGIQPDGRIVAAGYSWNGSNDDFTLARYNANGTLDANFGTGGIVITAVGSGDNSARALGIQPDGRIVVAGKSWDSGNSYFALARYWP